MIEAVGILGSAVLLWFLLLWMEGSPEPSSRVVKRKLARLKRRREKITAQIRELHGGGTRCPNCLRWPWDSDEPHKWTCTSLPAEMTCGTCHHVSHWVDGPVMFPVPAPRSAPIEIGEDEPQRVFVIRTPEMARVVDFFQSMGLGFVEEQHGDGPVHHACARHDALLEIYPGEKSSARFYEPKK